MSTFLELQSAVMDERFDAGLYRDRVKGWINDAQRKLRRRLRLPHAVAVVALPTVANQPAVLLPTDLVAVDAISYPGVDILERAETSGPDRFDPSFRGRPERYMLMGNPLVAVLSPTPDAIYPLQLEYVSASPKLVADTDVPWLPEEYHDCLRLYATALAYGSEEDRELKESWMGDFETEVARLLVDMNDQDDEPHQVPGMWGLDGFRG